MNLLFKYLLHWSISLNRRMGLVLLVLAATLGAAVQPAQATGSRELVEDGGHRPYMEWSTLTTAGITRQTPLRVYVQAGETVHLGSSVHTSSDGKDIVYRSPFGGQNGVCDVLSSGDGFIDTLAKEANGPLPNAGGYTSCNFVATETGVYEIEFHSPGGQTDPTPIAANQQFYTDTRQGPGVSAWDVTVRSSNGTTQLGRVFARYIAMNMGGNAGGIALNSDFFIQTKDGYRYVTDMNGIDPFGFIFFANSRGFIDLTNGSTLYRSARATTNALNFTGNIRVQSPTVPDTATDITHLLFFERPAPLVLTALGIPTSPLLPAAPTNFKFTGGTGGSGNQTYVGVGGNFSFDSASEGTYQIIIDTNSDGVYDPSSDRVLQNPARLGSNVVQWDGKNAAGVDLPARPGNAPYNARITLRAGEYHFPMLDAENNPNGFKITMENPPGPFPNILDRNGQNIGPATVYYNDDSYTAANGVAVNLDPTGTQVATTPRNAARGVNSGLTGEHEFRNLYGDFKGIDTWAFFPSEPVSTPLIVTASNQANVRGTKSVRFLTDADATGTATNGDEVEYTITFSNLSPGNSDAINFIINETLPPHLTFVSASIKSQTAGNTITLNAAYSGSGALTNSGTLRVGDTITLTLVARVSNATVGESISNQANATFSTPDNPATVGTVVTDADSAGSTSASPAVGGYFLQILNDSSDQGNDPSKTGDDDPTLFTVSQGYVVSPATGQLIINEVLYRQTGADAATNDEFIELYNASSAPVSLDGWRLADGNLISNDIDGTSGAFNYLFPAGTTLGPGEYAVIWLGSNAPDKQASGAAFQVYLGYAPKLNNTGDDIWLYDSQLRTVDYVAYGSGSAINTPPPGALNLWNAAFQTDLGSVNAGQSISLTPNGVDGNTSACWEPTTSRQAESRCSGYLFTRDTDPVGTRVTSAGVNNNEPPVASVPNLLLVKRITAINGVPVAGFVDGVNNPASENYVSEPYTSHDNDPFWPDVNTYLRGSINGGVVMPGDEVEYTIYFLSNGTADMANVTICDRIPSNTTFIPNAFNGAVPLESGGLAGTDVGIALALSGTSLPMEPTAYLTNAGDGDRGQFFPVGTTPAANCSGSNTNGAVVVNLVNGATTLPHAIAPGMPFNSYGFIRFRARVN